MDRTTGSRPFAGRQRLVTDWDGVDLTDDTLTEWSDGTLDNVRISSIDDGELQIIQPTLEVGSTTATTSWSTITLSNQGDQPVVIASLLDGNNPTTGQCAGAQCDRL